MGYVGNVYAHLPLSVGGAAQGEGIVEVFGVGRVDGEGGNLAEVFAPGYLFGGDFLVDGVGDFFELLWVSCGQAELGEYGVHFGIVFAALSQYLYNFALRAVVVEGPVGEPGNDLLALLGTEGLCGGNVDVRVEGAAVDPEEELPRSCLLDRAHYLLGGAPFDNVGNFGLAFVFAVVDGHILHPVAREGMAGVAFAHFNGFAAVVGGDGEAVVVACECTAQEEVGRVAAVTARRFLQEESFLLHVFEQGGYFASLHFVLGAYAAGNLPGVIEGAEAFVEDGPDVLGKGFGGFDFGAEFAAFDHSCAVVCCLF